MYRTCRESMKRAVTPPVWQGEDGQIFREEQFHGPSVSLSALMLTAFLSFLFCLCREKLKKKLEESGGLTFQIPQFSTEYGMRRVPTVKKIKQLKTDKSMKIKDLKDKKDLIVPRKLTAKIVGDSLDMILRQSKEEEEDDEEEEDEVEIKSPPKVRPSSSTSSSSSIKKGAAEKVSHLSCMLSCALRYVYLVI